MGIQILDEKKRYKHEQYVRAHLKISLIAEETGDCAMGIRFLNKLYKHFSKMKSGANVDVKVLALSISRIKLKTCTEQKYKQLMRKYKAFDRTYHSDSNVDSKPAFEAEYAKCKALIIQNLCRNPIQKTNDLMKESSDSLQVVCWFDIIQEFETLFLRICQVKSL